MCGEGRESECNPELSAQSPVNPPLLLIMQCLGLTHLLIHLQSLAESKEPCVLGKWDMGEISFGVGERMGRKEEARTAWGPAEQHCCGVGVSGGNRAENAPRLVFCHRHSSWTPLSIELPPSLISSQLVPRTLQLWRSPLIAPFSLFFKSLSRHILNILLISRALEI